MGTLLKTSSICLDINLKPEALSSGKFPKSFDICPFLRCYIIIGYTVHAYDAWATFISLRYLINVMIKTTTQQENCSPDQQGTAMSESRFYIPLRRGDPCPKCRKGKLDYDSLLELACAQCGFVLSDGSWT